MNVVLWVLQGMLSAMFLISGVTKSTQPREKLIPRLSYIEDFTTPVVRLIGGTEFAASVGLILPAATGIFTVLTPLAAAGLALIMLLAAAVHARRKEPGAIVFNAVVFIAAGFVAWGRFGPYAL